jgi:hypothetical protein
MAKTARAKRKPARKAAPRLARKHPATTDFDVVVQVGKRTVSVLFRPTKTHYLFRVVAGDNAASRAGAKPPAGIELHARTPGYPGRYAESEVLRMSERLASAAVKDVFL